MAEILARSSKLVGRFEEGVFDDSAAVTKEPTYVGMVHLARRIVELAVIGWADGQTSCPWGNHLSVACEVDMLMKDGKYLGRWEVIFVAAGEVETDELVAGELGELGKAN